MREPANITPAIAERFLATAGYPRLAEFVRELHADREWLRNRTVYVEGQLKRLEQRLRQYEPPKPREDVTYNARSPADADG